MKVQIYIYACTLAFLVIPACNYIFTDEERLVEKLDYDTPLGKSDHVCLTWSYIIKVTEDQQMPNISMLNYWKGNYSQMNAELKQVNWDDEFAGKATEESWDSFKQILENSIQKNLPVKKVDQTAMRKNPWITKSTKRKILKRNKAWKLYRTIPTGTNYG